MIDHVNVPKTAKAVFVKAECLPDKINAVELLDCILAVIGRGTIAAAWKQSGTWLIYPWTEQARAKMVTNIFTAKGKQFELDGNDPTHIPAVGEFKQRTKLSIYNLPLHVSNPDVGLCLSEAGFTLRSPVKHDVIKTTSGDEAMGGKRYVYIDLPEEKPDKLFKIGDFTAILDYKEMKESNANTKCRNCLKEGHRAKDCPNEPVCWTCKKSGHKKGDPRCDLGINKETKESDEAAHQTFLKNKEADANATFVRDFDRAAGSSASSTSRVQTTAEQDQEGAGPGADAQNLSQDDEVLTSGGDGLAAGGTPPAGQSAEEDGPSPDERESSSHNVSPGQSKEGSFTKLFSEAVASTPSKKKGKTNNAQSQRTGKDATPSASKGFIQSSIDKFGVFKRRLGDRSPPSPSDSQDAGVTKRAARPRSAQR